MSTSPAEAPRPLNIALINNLYPPYIVGGNEILARDVVEGLRARGHEVHVITGRGRELPVDGFTHPALDIDLDHKADYFLGGLPLTARRVLIQWHLVNPTTTRNVKAALARIRPDLVIAWNLYMASAAPLLAAHSYGAAPIIAHPADKWLLYSLNDIGALVPATTWMQKRFIGALRGVVQPALRRRARPDYILAVSEFIRTLHIEAGYAPAQSLATYLGIHGERFTYAPHPFPQGRPWRLLFAGQLWEGKGPQVAVEAVALLKQRGDISPVELDIFGGGAEGFIAYLRSLIAERKLDEAVKIRGFASQPELAAAFADHDIYLFCSTWDEPFSGGLLEAMGSGLPTIATTAGGTPEGVRHDENGLLVAPGDPQALAAAIVRLMRDPELYARIGARAGEEVAARWSFDAYLDRLEAAYRAIVAGHRPGAPVDLARTGPTGRERPVTTLRRLYAQEPGVAALGALAAAAWLLIALARVHAFEFWPIALPFVAVALWFGARAWMRSAAFDKWATLGLFALAALLYLPPAQTLALTGDAAIYTGDGAYIARTGGMQGTFEPLVPLSPAARDLFYISSGEQFGGVIAATAYDGIIYGSNYVVDEASPTIRTARMPQVESWLALLYKSGSLRAPFLLSPLFGALALCVRYAVGRRLHGRWIALWVALLLAVSYPQIYLARAPLAEIVGQFWSFAALLLALRWLGEKRPWLLAAALLLWTTAWSARIDTILLIGPVALLLMWAAAQRDRASLRAALLSAPAVLLLGILGSNPVYVGATAQLSVRVIGLLGPAAIAVCVTLPLLVGAAWLWGPSFCATAWPRIQRPAGILLFAFAAFVVLWSTLPNPLRDPATTRHFQEILWFSTAYVTPLLYWLALAGMGVLLLRGFDAPQGFILLTTLGLGAAYFYTYTTSPVYPISLRRLIGEVIPLMALLSGYAIGALGAVRLRPSVAKGLQVGLAAGALVWMGAQSLPLLTDREARDEVADVSTLHAQLPANGVFLFEPQDGDSWIGWLAAPLYALYGDWALLLESDRPDAESLALAVREFEAAGRDVYIVSQSSPAPAALVPQGYSATTLLSTNWQSALIGQTRAPYPPPYWVFDLPLYVYHVEPSRGE